jgi:hypothetical protein
LNYSGVRQSWKVVRALAVQIEKREDQRHDAEYVEQRILHDPVGYFREERDRVRSEVEREFTEQAD